MSTTLLQRAPRPLVPRSAESVQVLASSPPAEPHVDVALLQAEQSRSFSPRELDEMIARLREEAAWLGCDAIYLENSSEVGGDDDLRQLLAACIVFTPPDAQTTDALRAQGSAGVNGAAPPR